MKAAFSVTALVFHHLVDEVCRKIPVSLLSRRWATQPQPNRSSEGVRTESKVKPKVILGEVACGAASDFIDLHQAARCNGYARSDRRFVALGAHKMEKRRVIIGNTVRFISRIGG